MDDVKELSLSEVRERTGLSRDQLTALRRKPGFNAIKARKGRRTVFVYPEEEIPKLRRIKELLDQGQKLERAAATAEAELNSAAPARGFAPQPFDRLREFREFVSGKELGALIAAICIRRRMSPSEVNTRLRRWLHQSLNAGDVPTTPENCGMALAAALDRRMIPFDQACSLARLFGVHPLLIDPLFSQVAQGDRHVLSLSDDFLPVGDSRDKEYGSRVQYYVPWVRLPNSEAALGTLVLKPGGKSDVHSHPGDELMLCLSGDVVVRLEATGLDILLHAGSYIHFYAEQTHSAINYGAGKATLFIIRFYQTHSSGTREETHQEFDRLVAALNEARPATFSQQARPWIGAVAQQNREVVPSQDEVADLRGFGSFLKQFRMLRAAYGASTAGVPGVADLAAQSPELAAELARLEAGQTSVRLNELARIAGIYGIQEILLHSYLSPAVLGAVAIRGLFDTKTGKHDFREIATHLSGDGVKYRVPCRNLLYSDISLALLEIQAHGSTMENLHPGFELVLPLRGEVAVRSGTNRAVLSASRNRQQLLHYSSETPHEVFNPTNEPAEALVVSLLSKTIGAASPGTGDRDGPDVD